MIQTTKKLREDVMGDALASAIDAAFMSDDTSPEFVAQCLVNLAPKPYWVSVMPPQYSYSDGQRVASKWSVSLGGLGNDAIRLNVDRDSAGEAGRAAASLWRKSHERAARSTQSDSNPNSTQE